MCGRARASIQTVTSEVTQRAGREGSTTRSEGEHALLFAARVGDAESARILIEAGADVNDRLPDGTSALVEAAHSGQQAVGVLLLDKGADPNAAASGYTALHAAVLRGRLDLVKALLAHGADPNAQITKGTPVRRNSEDFELPATLVGATPYLLAGKFLEVDIMRVLATGGADPRLPMKTGTTPLMAVAGLGAGTQADRRGLSVLDGGKVADERRVLEATRVAFELGSDVNAMNQAGVRPPCAAAMGWQHCRSVHRGPRRPTQHSEQARADAVGGDNWRREGATAADRANQAPRQSTVDLLRKLGADE